MKKLLVLVVVFFMVIQAGFAQENRWGTRIMEGVYRRQNVRIATSFFNSVAGMQAAFDYFFYRHDNDFSWERLPANQLLGGLHLMDFALSAVDFSREASSGFRITEQEGQANSPHSVHRVSVFLPSSTIMILVRDTQPGPYFFYAWVRRD